MPYVPRFLTWDADALRRASSVESFPYVAKTTTLLRVSATGVVTQATSATEKRALLADTGPKDLVVAAWRGQWRSDVFLVDDVIVARAAVG